MSIHKINRAPFESIRCTKSSMLKPIARWAMPNSSSMLPILSKIDNPPCNSVANITSTIKLSTQRSLSSPCGARRRVRYEEDDVNDDGDYGHNEEVAALEFYSQSAGGEALLVHATVDEQEVEVLIFKGFSSCLSYGTSPDPSRSVLPARAVIKSIDRIKGPFDPSSIEYIEKGLPWESFKTRLGPTST